MKRKLRDAVVVVTGASSGIGRTTATAFSPHGSSVALAARRESILFKRLTEASAMGDLRKGFTILFALTDRLRRVTEGNNRQYVQLVRDTEERFEIIETHESHPIRANSFRPRCQDHRLNRSAGISHGKFCLLNRNNNC